MLYFYPTDSAVGFFTPAPPQTQVMHCTAMTAMTSLGDFSAVL